MAFGTFGKIDDVLSKYKLAYQSVPDLFPAVAPIEPGPVLSFFLGAPAAAAVVVRTEAQLREAIIAPFLYEAMSRATEPTLLWAEVAFNVTSDLSGYPDFLIGRGRDLGPIQAPLLAVIEAKRDDFTEGAGQCAAAMVAAREFNAARGEKGPIFGCVTNGTLWFIYRLDDQKLTAATDPFYLIQPGRILGALVAIMSGTAPTRAGDRPGGEHGRGSVDSPDRRPHPQHP